jgi:predicted nucleotidyltransferase
MSKLSQILKRKEQRREKLQAASNSIVDQLVRIGAIKIFLFGSLVNDNVDVCSDVDLLVIMPSIKSGKEWMKLIYENINRMVASDVFVYNEKEFAEMLPISSFLRHIVKSGRILYEKTP